MTTITLTKTNYFDVIQEINGMLFSGKELILTVDTKSNMEKLYDEAMSEYKKDKTIYGGVVITNGD